jgi:predicted XRE-type DNA-binding protein
MKNFEIRRAMKENRLFSYEVAAALGIADSTMSRKMRKELDEEEKQKILEVIEKLARGEL